MSIWFSSASVSPCVALNVFRHKMAGHRFFLALETQTYKLNSQRHLLYTSGCFHLSGFTFWFYRLALSLSHEAFSYTSAQGLAILSKRNGEDFFGNLPRPVLYSFAPQTLFLSSHSLLLSEFGNSDSHVEQEFLQSLQASRRLYVVKGSVTWSFNSSNVYYRRVLSKDYHLDFVSAM